MKKILLLLIVLLGFKVFAQWHKLPGVPNCVVNPNIAGSNNPICPNSLSIAGDGHILYADFIYLSPSSGSITNIYESHDDLQSATAKITRAYGSVSSFYILGYANNSSFLFYCGGCGTGLSFTNDDFSHINYPPYCSYTSYNSTYLYPNYALTNNYIYFYGQNNTTDSFVVSCSLNTQSTPRFCNHLTKYNGQHSTLSFVNDSVGYLLCNYRNNTAKQVFLKTIDYGTTWTEIYDSLTNVTSFNFPSKNTGYLLKGDGSIIKTSDGGNTWNSLNGTTTNSKHIAFSTDSIGYVAGHEGFLMRTADGGNTWVSQISNTTYSINYLFAFPGDVAYFIDSASVIYKNKSLLSAIKQNKNIFTNINIYPNPAQNNFTIETNSAEKQTINIFDVNGKLVLTQTIQGNTTVDVSNLNAGIYNLSLLNGNGIVNKKLVIVR